MTAVTHAAAFASPPRRDRRLRPLARRLTFAVTILLLIVIGGMLWLAHRRVNSAVVDAELSRLQASSDQLAATLHAAVRRLLQDHARFASSEPVVRSLRAARPGNGAQPLNLLASSPSVLGIVILDPGGRTVASTGDHQAVARMLAAGPPAESRPLIQPLVARGDSIVYLLTAPVIDDGTIIGTAVALRRLSSSGELAALVAGLVGRGSKVMLGNASSDLWTDLGRPVAGPSAMPNTGPAEYVDGDGIAHLGAATPIPDTPWLVMMQVPRALATQAASRFALEMLSVAAVFIVIGAMLSWLVIRRSMRPLGDVTIAAKAVTRGDYSPRVRVEGSDEIAVLAETFNEMAERVDRSAAELVARARDLEAANADLQESELRYRALFEHLPDGIVVHRDTRIIFANPAAVRILGVASRDELVGRSVLDFVSGHDTDLVSSRIERIESGHASVPTVELRLQRADRKQSIIEVTSRSLMVDGGVAVQTIMHDVSERRHLEEQLRQSQKMDAVGRLAGGVAHDFNNLLTVIQAHSEFALSETEAPDAWRSDVEQIRATAESAARLTRQLLTFSRHQVLSPAVIDLNQSIAGVLGMIRRIIGDDIEVMTALDDALAPVWADPGQVQQVLLNLAVNARDAMPHGGMLRFETANVTIGEGYLGASASLIPPGDYVMVAVQDTGVGMTEEVRSRVFEPFFTTKQAGHGTGLGLSTVYGIVRQSHGHIWLYSEPEMGTTFKVYLPPYRDAGAAVESPPPDEPGAAPTGDHVMVVEDEATVRAAICRALTRAGYGVTEAANADEALSALAGDERIALVITDMVMPGRSGIDLATEIAARDASIPVIILSGYSGDAIGPGLRVPQHAVFMEKPVSPKVLIRRVAELLAADR